MKKFHDGAFYGNFMLTNANENRFSLTDSLLFLSATTDSTSFLMIDMHDTNKQIPAGEVVRESTGIKTVISNRKYILCDKAGSVFAVSDCYPYIDQYDAHGKYIRTFDISSISLIKTSKEYAETFSPYETSIYRYIMDAYLAGGYIYLLCSSGISDEDYRVNTILKLSVDNEMEHIATYVLPHEFYSSFCLSDTFLYVAQEVRGATIERICINDCN
ncbi:hypothetical protein [uncultured Bacteroides sp.]|uniref:hypothetical protein n=1 Tax=uncultured Bacteroides sp. TaxID=162156 RepID=UPI002616E9FC|nr:hypothetical protein [uncultured Bacteroides sp.]